MTPASWPSTTRLKVSPCLSVTVLMSEFDEEIKKTGEGADVVIDFVGKNYFEKNIEILNRDGVVVYLAFLSGTNVDNFNLGHLLRKRLTLKGSTLRSRTVEYQSKLLQSFKEKALPLILDGQMTVEVHEVFPWTQVIEAQKEMAANKNSGKVCTVHVLELTPDRFHCHRQVENASYVAQMLREDTSVTVLARVAKCN